MTEQFFLDLSVRSQQRTRLLHQLDAALMEASKSTSTNADASADASASSEASSNVNADENPLEKFRGTTVVFGKWTGIDGKGRLSFNVLTGPEEWIPFLARFEKSHVAVAVSDAKRRQALEIKVANALGIERFSCDPDIAQSYNYEALMGNILNEVDVDGQTRPKTDIKVHVRREYAK